MLRFNALFVLLWQLGVFAGCGAVDCIGDKCYDKYMECYDSNCEWNCNDKHSCASGIFSCNQELSSIMRNNSNCNVNCNEHSSCRDLIVYVNKSDSININCNDVNSCLDMKIIILQSSINTMANVNCNHQGTCDNLLFECNENSNCHLNCDADLSCKSSTVSCKHGGLCDCAGYCENAIVVTSNSATRQNESFFSTQYFTSQFAQTAQVTQPTMTSINNDNLTFFNNFSVDTSLEATFVTSENRGTASNADGDTRTTRARQRDSDGTETLWATTTLPNDILIESTINKELFLDSTDVISDAIFLLVSRYIDGGTMHVVVGIVYGFIVLSLMIELMYLQARYNICFKNEGREKEGLSNKNNNSNNDIKCDTKSRTIIIGHLTIIITSIVGGLFNVFCILTIKHSGILDHQLFIVYIGISLLFFHGLICIWFIQAWKHFNYLSILSASRKHCINKIFLWCLVLNLIITVGCLSFHLIIKDSTLLYDLFYFELIVSIFSMFIQFSFFIWFLTMLVKLCKNPKSRTVCYKNDKIEFDNGYSTCKSPLTGFYWIGMLLSILWFCQALMVFLFQPWYHSLMIINYNESYLVSDTNPIYTLMNLRDYYGYDYSNDNNNEILTSDDNADVNYDEMTYDEYWDLMDSKQLLSKGASFYFYCILGYFIADCVGLCMAMMIYCVLKAELGNDNDIYDTKKPVYMQNIKYSVDTVSNEVEIDYGMNAISNTKGKLSGSKMDAIAESMGMGRNEIAYVSGHDTEDSSTWSSDELDAIVKARFAKQERVHKKQQEMAQARIVKNGRKTKDEIEKELKKNPNTQIMYHGISRTNSVENTNDDLIGERSISFSNTLNQRPSYIFDVKNDSKSVIEYVTALRKNHKNKMGNDNDTSSCNNNNNNNNKDDNSDSEMANLTLDDIASKKKSVYRRDFKTRTEPRNKGVVTMTNNRVSTAKMPRRESLAAYDI